MTNTEYQALIDEVKDLISDRWYLNPDDALISSLVKQTGKENIPEHPNYIFVGGGNGHAQKKLYRKGDRIVLEDYNAFYGYLPRQILFDDGRATGSEKGSLDDLL